MSEREKKNKFKKIVPKCILCKQPGGTIFSTKFDDKLNARILSARCGNVADPCDLNIRINAGKYNLYPESFAKTVKTINELKTTIIEDKNKLLFGYKTAEEILSEFDDLKEQITLYTDELEIIIREYYNIIDNKEDNERFAQLTEKSFELIKNIKESMRSFDEDDDQKMVFDAVEIYTNELVPTLNQIMELKYKNNVVWFNPDTRVYQLIQEKTSVKDIEVDFSTAEVISFNVTLGTKKTKDKNQDDGNEYYAE